MQKVVAGGLALACSVLLAQGCGRSKSPTAPAPIGTGKTVASINAIQIGGAPDSAPLTVGDTRQLSANAQMSDGTSQDLTSLVEWASLNPDVASVTSSGLVTALGPGDARVRARYGDTSSESAFSVVGKQTGSSGHRNDSSDNGSSGNGSGDGSSGGSNSGSAGGSNGSSNNPSGSASDNTSNGVVIPPNGTDLPPTVQNITITGNNTVPVGRSIQLRVIAHMSDGTDRDVTASADWRTDNSILGSITQNGLLTGLIPGSNIVTATYNGQSASQPVTITPL